MGKNKNREPFQGTIAIYDKLNISDPFFISIFNNLKELYISAYKWNGLPERVNERYLELALFDYGSCVFFHDEVMGFLALKGILAGQYDVYYEPTRMQVYGGGGYQNVVRNHEDAVLIYANYVRDTPLNRIYQFATRIYNLERTIDINIHAQRTPFLLKTTKQQEYTMKNIYKKYDSYEPVIIADNSFDENSIKVLETNAPFVADKLEEQKRKLWNEVLSYIGIENNYSEKEERLTSGEVLVSNGLSIANRQAKLESRQKACDEINKLFGLNVSVEVKNSTYVNLLLNERQQVGSEGIGNGML